MALPSRAELVASVLGVKAALTLVEGAGGLLVELGSDGTTLRDVAADLAAPVLVVVASGLGTLNHTTLTLEALANQGIPCAGLVIGAWPAEPEPAEASNWDALTALAPLRAVLPTGAGSMSAQDFEKLSVSAFDPAWVESLV
jgi:dethiobiotin synthetase